MGLSRVRWWRAGLALGLAGVVLAAGASSAQAGAPEPVAPVGAVSAPGSAAPGVAQARAGQGWLARVNQLRTAAGLPAVIEDPALSAADQLHAEYMARNQTIGHSEDATKPGYTAAGNAAAGRSNVAMAFGGSTTDAYFVDLWVTGPFHAVGVLRPGVTRMGYGVATDSRGARYAALDVISGNGPTPASVRFPVTLPSAAAPMPLRSYGGGEWPDPLTGCPGWTTPVSAPMLVTLGRGAPTPTNVTAELTSGSGLALSTCVLTEQTYTSPDAGAQSTGRALLAEQHTVVVYTRVPLAQAAAYRLTVRLDGRVVTVPFVTEGYVEPPPPPTRATRAPRHLPTGQLAPRR